MTAPILYPQTYNSYFSRCTFCFQTRTDISVCADPSDPAELRRLCRRCDRALRSGVLPDLDTEDLIESWVWLARQHQNHRDGEETFVDDTVIDAALCNLTFGNASMYGRRLSFTDLKQALLDLQDAETGEVDYASLEPQWRNAGMYANRMRGLVDEAVHKLVGRT